MLACIACRATSPARGDSSSVAAPPVASRSKSPPSIRSSDGEVAVHQVDEQRRELRVELRSSPEALASRHHRRTGLQVLEEDLVEDVAFTLVLVARLGGDRAESLATARPSAWPASRGRSESDRVRRRSPPTRGARPVRRAAWCSSATVRCAASVRPCRPGSEPGSCVHRSGRERARRSSGDDGVEPVGRVSSRRRQSPGNRGCLGLVPKTTAPRSSSPLDLSFAFGEN